MPAGYIVLACGLAVILIASTYMIGHKQGYGAARLEFDHQIMNQSSLAASDPLSNLQPGIDNPPSGNPSSPGLPPTTQRAPTGTWQPVIPAQDPRQKGLNYFILAETRESGAKQLAEFCRSHGLETYVVVGNNDRSRLVVAFPGFEGSARNSPQVTALEDRIKTLGLQWKNQKGSGGDNLHGLYPMRYGG